MTQAFKDSIKAVAVRHFDRDGFHGTTIRNIAREAGCSLPMVYYYYQSKQALFHEIIAQDYFALIGRLARQRSETDALDFYTQFVRSVCELDAHDRMIYRLGVKVYLGFDGDDALFAIMDEWERSIMPRHFERLSPMLEGRENPEAVVRALVHLLENLIESIVVKQRQLCEADIRGELAVILRSR
jgi:AcrR family transcriptional regulator